MKQNSTKVAVALPLIDASRCTGCGWCVAACPDHLLVLELHQWRKSAELALPHSCTGCAKCIAPCNFGAIRMVRRHPVGEGASERAHDAA